MSVSQRKDGRWLVKYKEEGVWRQRAFRDETEARAFDSESTVKQMVETAATEKPTLGELALAYFKSNVRSLATRRHVIYCLCGHEDRMGRHIKGDGEFLRDKLAEALDRRDLEHLRSNFRQRGVSNNSINHYQAHIRAILAWAADQQIIPANPWRDFKRLPIRKMLVSVRMENFRLIYEHLPEWFQWAARTAFCLALRPGLVELFSLKWENFDWRRGLVHVRQGKSGAIKTVVPPQDYLDEAKERWQEDSAKGVEFVCTRNGRQVYAYLKDWWKACDAAGVRMRPYDIRHLAASEMLAGGADLASVAAQLGNASVTTTGRTYAHVLADGQSKAASLLPSLK